MLVNVKTCTVVGIDAQIVELQVNYDPRRFSSLKVTGLSNNVVNESRERVVLALRNSNFPAVRRLHGGSSLDLDGSRAMLPSQNRQEHKELGFGLQVPLKRYTVNLAPADIPKHGPSYDLPIAIGALAATDQVPLDTLGGAIFVGELSLDGRIHHVKGVLACAYEARRQGLTTIFVPETDAAEAALVPDIDVIPVPSLGSLVEHLYGLNLIPAYRNSKDTECTDEDSLLQGLTDFSEVRGQEHVKRALEVAAAGNHNVLLMGPPGSGKTLMARALPGILPAMTLEEALEVTRIYSVADLLADDSPLLRARPFRSPHHSISQAGLVGGGTIPRPGEISLAHRGVLFLDEFLEFGSAVLEVLRQPLEDKKVTISRAQGSLTFPSNFMLVAASNPCQCGYLGDPTHECTCTPAMIRRYQQRMSGPLLDRMDIHAEVPRVDYEKLTSQAQAESSAAIRARVEAAREKQRVRFASHPRLHANGDMGPGDIRRFCQLTPEAESLIKATLRQMQLSARAYHRVLKLSLTIADLADCDVIDVPHLAEAIQYRPRRLMI